MKGVLVEPIIHPLKGMRTLLPIMELNLNGADAEQVSSALFGEIMVPNIKQ